jgi:hypothetical protein
MLPLDDERWKQLSQRMGDAYPFITDSLKELLKNPANMEVFNEMIPHLCSEGTTYDSAHAAAPYLVELAQRLSLKERTTYLIWIGLIEIDSCPLEMIDDFLRDDYQKALLEAIPLTLEILKEDHEPDETRYLLAAIAAFKGFPGMGEILANLDTYEECPECDSEIFDYEAVMNRTTA